MRIEVLVSPGCGSAAATLALVAEVVRQRAPGAGIETVVVATPEEAVRLAFPGSPTVRVDGRDVEAGAPAGTGLG
jgi:hypothetical protein